MSKIKTQLVIEGRNNSRHAFNQVNSDLEGINQKLNKAGKALVAAFSVSMLSGAVRSISATADAYNLMNARLDLATESQAEFNTAQLELQRIAKATQSPIESLITLYTRISRPLKEAGRSQQDILKVTEAVSTSFRISGASATEAENGVIQFAQALGAGALRGDEFNSVAEQAPRLMRALAESLGVPVGALKEMAAAGELTASVVSGALIQQLGKLRQEAETLPDTVGGAMVDLTDKVNKAIGQSDMQPLIEGLNSLGETLSNPVVVENIGRLVNALVTLVGLAAKGGSAFVDFGDDLAYVAARASGSVAEIDRANKEIEYLQAAKDGYGVLDLYLTDKQIAERLAAWKDYRDQLNKQITGMAEGLGAVAEKAAAQEEDRRASDVESFSTYVEQLKTMRADQLKSVKDAAKEQVKAEQSALKDIEKIREKRIDIENRYKEALAGLGGGGEASYGQAEDLKLAARQALANNDIAGAQANAQAALEVLQELDSAGENTYGFAGFIKELQAIELAANDIEKGQAEEKLKAIRSNIDAISKAAKDLKDMDVSFTLDEAAIQALRQQILKLAGELGQELILPVALKMPDMPLPLRSQSGASGSWGSGASGGWDIPGYASGTRRAQSGLAWVGEMGPELVNLKGGERIFNADESARIASDMAGSAGGGPSSTLNLSLDGQNYALSGQADTIADLANAVRKANLKRR